MSSPIDETEFVFLGIDPGLHGAVAAIRRDRLVLVCEDFPINESPKAARYKKRKDKKTGELKSVRVQGYNREFDFNGIASLFDRIVTLPGKVLGMVEAVASMPRDSVTGAFTFGGSFWALQQALADRGVGYELVKPKAWQAVMLQGIAHDDPKMLRAAYLSKARKMFPSVDLRLQKSAEKAAALLIAEYCRRVFIHGVGAPGAPVAEEMTSG
jgi:hypothetical protein